MIMQEVDVASIEKARLAAANSLDRRFLMIPPWEIKMVELTRIELATS